jgi:hypothetical protein
MFTTGQEWGYWMQDYAVGRLHWDSTLDWKDIMRDWTGIMGEAGETVQTVLEEMALYQYDTLVNQDLMKYMAGEDENDELGEMVGIGPHPLRTSFYKVNTWMLADIKAFREGDLAKIKKMAEKYDAFKAALDEVKEKVPEKAGSWFMEIYDGTEINGLRCWHIYNLYEAVLHYREGKLQNDDAIRSEAQTFLESAKGITEKAKEVILRREAFYRYPLENAIGGGVTPETEKENGTVYKFRILTKAHLAFYWTRRDDQAKAILEGTATQTRTFTVHPAIALEKTPLTVYVPDASGIMVTIDFGDGGSGDKNTKSHEYTGLGYWSFHATVQLPNLPEETYDAVIGRVEWEAYAGSGSIDVKEPAVGVAGEILKSVLPRFHFGLCTHPTAPSMPVEPFLIVGQDLDDDGLGDPWTSAVYTLAEPTEATFKTVAGDMELTVQNSQTGDIFNKVTLKDGVFSGNYTAEKITTPVILQGGLSTEDVVDTLVLMGGMDREGAKKILANLLGYTVETLPEFLPFTAEIRVEP